MRPAATHVGRIGLLAVALGIGAAIAGGTAVAGAEATSSNAAGGGGSAQTSDAGPSRQSGSDDAGSRDGSTAGKSAEDSDDASGPAEPGDEDSGDDSEPAEPGDEDSGESDETDEPADEGLASAPAAVPDAVRTGRANDVASRSARTTSLMLEVAQQDERIAETAADLEPVAPAPSDQTPTPYGDIGKWMLQPGGEIADYGGLPYEGRTVLEPVNVVIVDTKSRSKLEAIWRLDAAMRRAGFPPRFGHTTGFRGLIDNERYRQRPGGLLVGYSDDSFLVTNNHGRIFGPDPVETASGYVWSGAFSTEEFVFAGGLPRHTYVSSNQARDALARDMLASGRATAGGTVFLDNAYNTDTVTTGDHDGQAVVIILGAPMPVLRQASNSRVCAGTAVTGTTTAGCGVDLVGVGRRI